MIVPFDKDHPNKVIGNGYMAQLSPTVSMAFAYDISPAHQGKTCTLVFHIPPAFEYPDLAPIKIRAPGGMSVSRLSSQVFDGPSIKGAGSSTPIGGVAYVQPGHQYNIASIPCEAGQKVGYQIDSLNSLSMDWFQMTNPPLGLFVLVT